MTSELSNCDLSFAFLSQGFGEFDPAAIGRTTLGRSGVSWSFQELLRGSSGLPVLLQCTLRAWDLEVLGFGDGVLQGQAARRAFCEAWERLWFRLEASGRLRDSVHGRDTSERSDSVRIGSTNGFAAGSNSLDAVNRARAELIERAALHTAWTSRQGWQPLRSTVSTWKVVTAAILGSYLAGRGWKVIAYRLAVTPHVAVAALATHASYGAVFDCAAAEVGPEANEAKMEQELKAKTFMTLVRAAMVREKRQTPEGWAMPFVGDPVDHAHFYADPANTEAFRFLEEPASQSRGPQLEDENEIEDRIIVEATDFPAVAMAYHRRWPKLKWGEQSIEGENTWPHPLA